MSKIKKAIHEIHEMDSLSERNQWVNQLHPLVKFILTVVYIAVVVSFPKYDVAGVMGMMVYPVAIFLLADLSFCKSLERLRIVLPLVCFIGVFNPFFDQNYFVINNVRISAGVLSMITLILKGIFSVLASYLLIATTSIEKICYALRCLHVPKAIVTQIMLMYRYITVLLEEVERIMQAYMLRAPGQRGIHYKVWGTLVGQLLLKSVDRANAVYESMLLRGFCGEYQYMGEKVAFQWKDICYFLVWCVVFLVFRRYPVVLLAGSIFGGA